MNGAKLSQKLDKFHSLAADARCNEKIVGGRDAAIEHSLGNKNGCIHSVFFHCIWHLLLDVSLGFDGIYTSRGLTKCHSG
jgi:hypothetical protein